jgi:arginine transport system permease protein
MNILVLQHNLALMLSASSVTIRLLLASLTLGLSLSILLTLLWQTKIKLVQTLISAYLFLIRSTPMLLQFFIIYYASAQWGWLKSSPLWLVFKDPFLCATMALAINTSAYSTVLFKGAIDAVPAGEKEAAKVLGLSTLQGFFLIVAPRAMQRILPAYCNEVIMVLKGTSLASTITVLELTNVSHQIAARSYRFMSVFLTAALIYLLLNSLIIIIFHAIEKKWANKNTVDGTAATINGEQISA